jgi:hypothetical protein
LTRTAASTARRAIEPSQIVAPVMQRMPATDSISTRIAMSRIEPEAPSTFPHWVALGSLACVLWLFFTNTVSAVRERSDLRAQRAELVTMKRDYDLAIQEARLGLGPNAHFDLQALLVAYPERPAEPPPEPQPTETAVANEAADER